MTIGMTDAPSATGRGVNVPVTILARAALDTLFGRLGLYGTRLGLLSVVLPNESQEAAETRLRRVVGDVEFIEDPDSLQEALEQLEGYVDGTRRSFDLTLDPRGTPFQLAVWDAVSAVGYGQTRSYGDIARAIGRPAAVRAVGAANGANPLPVIVPCHRIIGSNGTLTGYGGGLDLKQRLLAFERGRYELFA
jgi:O-6-methylguanine DNA methyltransferase